MGMTDGASEEPGHPVAGRVGLGTCCLPLLPSPTLFVLTEQAFMVQAAAGLGLSSGIKCQPGLGCV